MGNGGFWLLKAFELGAVQLLSGFYKFKQQQSGRED
jgi:hypothetical protein